MRILRLVSSNTAPTLRSTRLTLAFQNAGLDVPKPWALLILVRESES